MTPNACAVTLDVRTLAPHERAAMILSVFRSLLAGQALQVIGNRDEQLLQAQLQSTLPGKFCWDELEQGPSHWRAAITRLAPAHAGSACCGACGGA